MRYTFQAGYAGSIPVARSHTKPLVRACGRVARLWHESQLSRCAYREDGRERARYGDRMQPPTSVLAGTVEAIWSPNIQVGRPLNTRPMAGAVVEALHEGNVVAATTTDDAGRYELIVHPGTYLIPRRPRARVPQSPAGQLPSPRGKR
jgi:hypothetical protein